MANHGLFMGWNRPIPGREKQAAEYFASAITYYTRLQKEGVIESFEPVLLARHGGDMNGFFLVRGDRDKLNKLTASDEFKQLVLSVDVCVSGFGVVSAALGDELATQMAMWQKEITKY